MADFVKPVVFYQDDRRWADNLYSNHDDLHQTMRSSGSGPTLMADIVATLIDPSVTPWDMARLALEWGDRTYCSGTAWPFFKHTFRHFDKFSKFVETSDYDTMIDCLNHGGYVVCSMRPGYWCRVENYYLAWKYDSNYVYCISSYKKKRERQSIQNFKKECRRCFCFYPKTEEKHE